jgi:succinoglycan biosynthesis protein ExoA
VSDESPTSWPDVDVVMPIRNEADHLEAAVAAVRKQDYPGTVRIILGVGPSDDGTEVIARRLAETNDRLVVVDNPGGLTPSALNVAIREGSAPVVVRVDGHSELSDGYIQRAVETLQRTGAANVGGRQVPVPTTPFEEGVAAATTSWLGTGGASYRVGGTEGPVDTVFMGVFSSPAIEAVGRLEERLIRNQDYELNIRLRKAGGDVWFDPELAVGYRPRGSWRSLARQYFEYGQWKAVVMRMHPDSARVRQLVPPIVVAGVALSTILSLRRARFICLPTGYAATLFVVASSAKYSGQRIPVSASIALIHVSWTAGLVVNAPHMLKRQFGPSDPSPSWIGVMMA